MLSSIDDKFTERMMNKGMNTPNVFKESGEDFLKENTVEFQGPKSGIA